MIEFKHIANILAMSMAASWMYNMINPKECIIAKLDAILNEANKIKTC